MKRLAPLALFIASFTAAQAANTSVYTTYDTKTCKVVQKPNYEEEFGGSYLCKGYGGMKIYSSGGDLREVVAIGKNPADHCAASQSFGHFNSTFSKVEWRLAKGKPIATIQRWYVANGEENAKDKEWLVVTKLEANNSCRSAVIEGAYPNANEKAREMADQAPSFNCKTDEVKLIMQSTTNPDDISTSGSCE